VGQATWWKGAVNAVECLGATMTKTLKRRNIVMCLLLRFTPSHLQIWCLLSDVPGHPSKHHSRHLHDLYHAGVVLWKCSIRFAALLVLIELRQSGGRPNNTSQLSHLRSQISFPETVCAFPSTIAREQSPNEDTWCSIPSISFKTRKLSLSLQKAPNHYIGHE
jgi:hypothetical protein